jgi:hypothetical protein
MTHTHTGCKPNVAYRTRGRLAGHSEAVVGKAHALNAAPPAPYLAPAYLSLCGETVSAVYHDEAGDEVRCHVRAGGTVTCKRCLARLEAATHA